MISKKESINLIDQFKNRGKETDDLITWIMVILSIISIVAVTSASMNFNSTVASTFRSMSKQCIVVFIGLIVYALMVRFYTNKRCKDLIDIVAAAEFVLLLAAYFYCKAYGSLNGNYSWIYFNSFSIQPSEFAKPVAIMLIAAKLADRKFASGTKEWEVLRYPVSTILLYLFIIVVLQKDTGSAVIILIVSAITMMIPRHDLLKRVQITIMVLAALAIACFAFLLTANGQQFLQSIGLDTFANRFRAVTNPSYSDDGTREIFYSLLGISKGKLFGVGIGESVQKFGYLVSSDADYIFAIIVEETGLLGIFTLFILYATIIYRLLFYAKKMKLDLERTVLIGTAIYMFVHFILNIGGVSGFLPLTGVPLLLVSRGGSSTFAAMALLGCCQAIIDQHITAKKMGKEI